MAGPGVVISRIRAALGGRPKRLRLSGVLIAFGLVVEALTLFWNHPVSLFSFLTLGALPLLAGIGLYLSASLR